MRTDWNWEPNGWVAAIAIVMAVATVLCWPRLRPRTKWRIKWAAGVGLILITVVVALLIFADTFSAEPAKQCAPNILKAKLPMWLGCAMTTYQDLSAGLLAGAGALFAAWLAFQAVQEQIEEAKNDRERQQAEGKEAAIICITQPVHAAAAALSVISVELAKTQPNGPWRSVPAITTAIRRVEIVMDNFMIRESLRDLNVNDRILYLIIVGTLSSWVIIAKDHESGILFAAYLEKLRSSLLSLHRPLGGFDQELASVFARDSQTVPQNGLARGQS